MKILYYNAKTESKIYSLRRVFETMALPGTGITLHEVTEETLVENLTNDVALLVLPGARAGTAYRDQIRDEKLEHLKTHLARGMQILGICAGAYVLAKNSEYDVYDEKTGEHLERKNVASNMGIVNVRAYGPDLRLYPVKPREKDNPWSVYTAAQVTSQNQTLALALSKGPSFTDLDPEQCSAFATYVETGEAAIVRFNYGAGGGLLSGPAIEIGGENLANYIHPDHKDNPQCRDIVNALTESRSTWATFCGDVICSLLPTASPDIHNHIRSNLARIKMAP